MQSTISNEAIVSAMAETANTLAKQMFQTFKADTQSFRDEIMAELDKIQRSIAELHTLQKQIQEENQTLLEKKLLAQAAQTANDINTLRVVLIDAKPAAKAPAKGKGKVSLDEIGKIADQALGASGIVSSTSTNNSTSTGVTTTTSTTTIPAGSTILPAGTIKPKPARKPAAKKAAAPKVKPPTVINYLKAEGPTNTKFVLDTFFSESQRQAYDTWTANPKNIPVKFWTAKAGVGATFTDHKTSEEYIGLLNYLQKQADDINAKAAAEAAANDEPLAADPDSDNEFEKELFGTQ